MNTGRKTGRLLIIFTLLAVVSGAALLLVSQRSAPDKQIVITNISDCTPDIDSNVLRGINKTMYTFVKRANDYNHKGTLPSYESSIRNGSCHTDYGNGKAVIPTQAILDIRDARQSWKITFSWAKAGKVPEADLGTVEPTCLPADKLPYGDFNCEKIMSLITYGTDKYDPILQYMPYNGSSFDLSYDPETKTVSATVLVPPEQANNTVLISNVEAAVPIWLQNKGLNPNNYTIKYRVVSQDL